MEMNSLEYYRRREQQERSLAESARDSAIAVIHLELAERYLTLIDQIDVGMRP